MASKNQFAGPLQHRGAAGVPMRKQKIAAAEEGIGKNRRALGDIGNVVNVRITEGKLPSQISRPITRSFGAQLLANAQSSVAIPGAGGAQAAAAAVNKKPPGPSCEGGAGRGRAVKQQVKQKAPPPKAEEVIVISPNTQEQPPEDLHPKEKNKTLPSSCVSKKKKDHSSLTSVLTARSKAAAHDIDSSDANDELAVVDYVEDLYDFYKVSEEGAMITDYMGSQTEINGKMRAILADWLIEVHHKFTLMPETLYLTFYVIDRYLSLEVRVPRRELQLVGVGAMLVACKYEEIWAPEVNDFICISDRAYTREQILAMEKAILSRLRWSLTVPTPYVFLLRFLKAAAADQETENAAFFFSELALMNYSMLAFRPSLVAASAVYAARCTLKKSPIWTETLKAHTGLSEPQLWECALLLAQFHAGASESKLKVVHKKYSSLQRGGVALLPPALAVIEETKAAAAASVNCTHQVPPALLC